MTTTETRRRATAPEAGIIDQEALAAWTKWPDSPPSHTDDPKALTWRGRSLTTISATRSELADIAAGLDSLIATQRRAEATLIAEVEKLLGLKVHLGSAPCPESPTGACIHHATAPSASCLICGDRPRPQ